MLEEVRLSCPMPGAWAIVERGQVVVVRFGEHVSTAEGEASARALLAKIGSRSFELQLDLRETRGYESGARKAWQEALWPRRGQLISIVVASRSAVPRMGASMFAAFLGIPCRHVAQIE